MMTLLMRTRRNEVVSRVVRLPGRGAREVAASRDGEAADHEAHQQRRRDGEDVACVRKEPRGGGGAAGGGGGLGVPPRGAARGGFY
jgi:hypothetical protein